MTSRVAPERARAWLHVHSLLTAAATIFLVFAGGMVTSTGSGLAVPDWPLSYGTLFPPMVGGIFYEHGHRLVAGSVAVLITAQALFAWRVEPRAAVRRLAWAAVAAVVLQAVLGGVTVIFLLPTAISVAHAGLANLFFCMVVALAWATSAAGRRASAGTSGGSTWRRAGVRGWAMLAGLIYLQMLMGALMRHTGAGLAIPDFPLSFGRLIPPLMSWPVGIHFAHRLGALAVTVAVLALAGRELPRRRPLHLASLGLLVLVPAQVLLGGWTVWSAKSPVITSAHVVTGTLCLGLAVWGCLALAVAGATRARAVATSLSLEEMA